MKRKINIFYLNTFVLLGSLLLTESLYSAKTQAQVIPDSTLGNEKSKVNQIDALNERIDGGARRGGNLFHSFQNFNINEGFGIYFANPSGVMNIFSRVTGGNPSQILGTLGVLGQSNLYFLNPYGIIFGPHSSLDIRGSFVGTTADTVKFADGTVFSAINPQNNALLTISVPLGLQTDNNNATLINRGNLVVGQDLTLSAGNLDLHGQLSAGGNLTLKALNTILITDSITHPFIAYAGGQFEAQSEKNVKINILNHSDSGLFAGGNLILRSAFPIEGDAHFWSGGHFRIERLDGSIGDLVSLKDPAIRSSGDVLLNSYRGASLHIIAGGSVTISETIVITGADTTANSIQETVTLSDGSSLQINGNLQPTLDIRAGVNANSIGSSEVPTSADITIGSVFNRNANGLVFITNQYQPNTTLNGGKIEIGLIALDDGFSISPPRLPIYQGNAGAALIDSRGAISLDTVQTSKILGNGGDVKLLAQENLTIRAINTSSFNPVGFPGIERASNSGDITLKSQTGTITILEQGQLNSDLSASGTGGAINFQAANIEIQPNTSISASTFGMGDAGNITLNATDTINITKGQIISITAGAGKSGTILINTGRLNVQDQSIIATLSLGTGNAGDLSINARQVILENSLGATSTLDSEEIDLETGIVSGGLAGNLNIEATESITLINTLPDAVIEIPFPLAEEPILAPLGLVSFSQSDGDAGNINLNTGRLSLQNGAAISASTFLKGQGGSITILATEKIEIIGTTENNLTLGEPQKSVYDPLPSLIASEILDNALGNGGDITIRSPFLLLKDGGIISTGTGELTQGQGGDLLIESETIILTGTSPSLDNRSSFLTATTGSGDAGNMHIDTHSLRVDNGALILTATSGSGDSGNLTVNATGEIELLSTASDNIPSGLSTGTAGSGHGKDLTINTPSLIISNGALVTAATYATGNGGNLIVNTSRGRIEASGQAPNGRPSGLAAGSGIEGLSSLVQVLGVDPSQATGNSGGIEIKTGELSLSAGAEISIATLNQGEGGTLKIQAETVNLSNFSRVSAAASGAGLAGNLQLNTNTLTLTDNSNITASSIGTGNAGNLTIRVQNTLTSNNSTISTSATQASGGSITISAQDIRLRGNSDIRTNVSSGAGGGGDINLNADSILAFNDSDILAFAQDGIGGNITLNTPVFFGNGYSPTEQNNQNPDNLDNNNRVDINASGAVSGVISVPDLTFIQNSLFEFPETLINTENLLANSCVVPHQQQAGTFVLTGPDGLPTRPNHNLTSPYPTGTILTIPKPSPLPKIDEPQGFYRLNDGKMVLSTKCN
ncbi:filamentous hemagglutinin N-terminal domain-containing protein [Chroococcus sp. FPU101]|uniref:two-partner secretion domain-containing protein n=1 Tax=Chroococcus sp. FPU101 TaxID=1974212 RepID=UPI001A8EB99F|nr:filamentous hemagglutinin N-terminal domain-containing protein [Chroococcus sp. FPU101]GFE70794.1 unknown protein [Chroococcus sp. FPU101]